MIMKLKAIDECVLAKKGAVKDYKIEWDANRYLVGGKMFAMLCKDRDGAPIITIKLQPDYGDFLRQQYENKIVPGYYMNKQHWNSVYLESNVSTQLILDMLGRAYEIVFKALPKKTREEILKN